MNDNLDKVFQYTLLDIQEHLSRLNLAISALAGMVLSLSKCEIFSNEKVGSSCCSVHAGDSEECK